MDEDPGHRLMAPGKSPAGRAREVALGPDKPERDELLRAFGQTLKRHRTLAGLTQRTLAERRLLRADEISHLEQGTRIPNLLVLLLLADAIGADDGELTGGLAAPTRRATRKQ